MRISSMESLLTHKFKVPGFEQRGLWKERVPWGIVASVYENRQNTIQTKIVKLNCTIPYIPSSSSILSLKIDEAQQIWCSSVTKRNR